MNEKLDHTLLQGLDLALNLKSLTSPTTSEWTKQEKIKTLDQLLKSGANSTYLAAEFASAGNHEQVDILREYYGANTSIIAAVYAANNNHNKVQDYINNYQANARAVALGYCLSMDPSISTAENSLELILKQLNSVADVPIDQLSNRPDNSLYQYWTRTNFIIERIAQALEALHEDASIETTIKNPNSSLHHAVTIKKNHSVLFENIKNPLDLDAAENTVFSGICSAARKAKNYKELKSMLGSLYLDAIQPEIPYLTAAGFLASRGHFTAVELLRQLGANVDGIARGYAVGRYHEQVEQFRTDYQVLDSSIAQGYALASEYALVEEYYKQNNKCIDGIIKGYAMSGNESMVQKYYEFIKPSPNILCQAYALAGNHTKVIEHRTPSQQCMNYIAAAYAYSGQHKQVEIYRSQHMADPNMICRHYIRAGDFNKVEEYRVHHQADVNDAVTMLARTNNQAKVELYRKKTFADLYLIIDAYVSQENQEQIDYYRDTLQVTSDFMIHSYAANAQHENVKEYLEQDNTNVIFAIMGYMSVSNHEQIEEYRKAFNIDMEEIARYYQRECAFPIIPTLYQALIRLIKEKPDSDVLIQQIKTLHNNSSAYTIFSSNRNPTKLQGILKAIEAIPLDQTISAVMNNKDSSLYKALNPSSSWLSYLGFYAPSPSKEPLEEEDQNLELKKTN